MKIKMQIARLYGLEFLTAFGLAQVIWLALLAGRGFSLAQIGLAEGFFHLVSVLCEVPSGMIADLLGRKRTLVAACLVRAAAALCMVASRGLLGVCGAMGLHAFSYNLISGTREAITYDSLLAVGRTEEYERVAGRQSTIWRVTGAACAVGTALTIALGWRRAYCVDAAAALAGALLAAGLTEPVVTRAQAARQTRALAHFAARTRAHIAQSLGFLVQNPRAACKMLADGGSGCAAALSVMLLQQYMIELGLPAAALGLPLLIINLAGALGAVLAPRLRLPFGRAAALCVGGVACSVLLEGAPLLALAVLGGAVATFWDGVLEIKMTARLNQDFPSDQRATLVSVQSMCYSLLMLPMSPLAGAVCGAAGTGAGIALLGAGLALGALAGFEAYRFRAARAGKE